MFWLHQTSDFGAVDTSLVEGGFERCVVGVGCQGGVWLAIKVVMVIMTSNGTPTGVTRRLSTGEIIFVDRVLELYISEHSFLTFLLCIIDRQWREFI